MNKPTIEVGIMSAESIRFKLNGNFRYAGGENIADSAGECLVCAAGKTSFSLKTGDGKELLFEGSVLMEPCGNDCSFELFDVVIGVKFHWERKENQRFNGKLKLMAEDGMITAVNILTVEDYLLSVISSEMSATSSTEFLKAHAVISRSWLLAQMEKGRKLKNAGSYQTFIPDENGYIRWYDREEHSSFDVCADDHCQRYQGITKVSSGQVYEALRATSGEVLMYEDSVCDARFYKCCGGITEVFENVWEPVNHPYLTKVDDCGDDYGDFSTDLTVEENAEKWITSRPPAYCNTTDREILAQVLNDYDRETVNFFRWETVLAQQEVQELLLRKVGIDVGEVLDLIPVERGASGRIIRLKIAGSRKNVVIGKELEIRKALSESHLYSSAFVVERVFDGTQTPSSFILKGAGWGHGVGLCQIGAAIMGAKGFSYEDILKHYFPKSTLKTIY